MTIMVVDDNVRMREVISSLFDDTGARVVECAGGEEAIRRYALEAPDWVLMDIRMKEMDGITASGALIGQHPDAKVIIVTEYLDPALVEAARSAGTCGFVAKEDLFSIKKIMGL